MTYRLDVGGYIRDQSLSGETVVLSEDSCQGLVASTFTSGTLRLAQSRYCPGIMRSTVTDTDVIAVTRQHDYRFFQARFIKCRFHGIFSGIDFGRSDSVERAGGFGLIEGCDFTDATLDDCGFFHADMSSMKLPRRDHAVLIEPGRRIADARKFEWPGLLGNYIQLAWPASVSALVMHLPSLVPFVRCPTDEIRAALKKFGAVVM